MKACEIGVRIESHGLIDTLSPQTLHMAHIWPRIYIWLDRKTILFIIETLWQQNEKFHIYCSTKEQ